MNEIINNLISIEQLLYTTSPFQQSQKVAENTDNKTAEKEEEESSSVNVNLSQKVLSELNSYMSTEDLLNAKINTAQTIYDSLGDVQNELIGLKQQLQETPEENTDELVSIDEKSNSLIQKVIDILKKDTYGIVDSKYLNNTFKKLNYIQNLSLNDFNYLNKINNLDTSIKDSGKLYNQSTSDLYAKLTEIYNKYESSAKDTSNTEKDSKEIQKNIVSNPSEALKSTSSTLSQEEVLRLIQGSK